MSDVLFDVETKIKKRLGVVPSVQVEAKKPETEKVESVQQQTEPAKESAEQSPIPQTTKQYPPYSPMARTVFKEAST